MSQWLDRRRHPRLAGLRDRRSDTPSLISCALLPPPGQQPIHLGQRLSSPAEASLLSVKMSLTHADWSYLSFGGSLCDHHSSGQPGSPPRRPECKPPPPSFPSPPGGAQPRPAAWVDLSVLVSRISGQSSAGAAALESGNSSSKQEWSLGLIRVETEAQKGEIFLRIPDHDFGCHGVSERPGGNMFKPPGDIRCTQGFREGICSCHGSLKCWVLGRPRAFRSSFRPDTSWLLRELWPSRESSTVVWWWLKFPQPCVEIAQPPGTRRGMNSCF